MSRGQAVTTGFYNMACLYDSRDHHKCREMLLQAEETGHLRKLKDHMRTDPDMDPVREAPWFLEVASRLELGLESES